MYSEYWEGRHCKLFAEKVIPNGLADVQEFSVVCSPYFQKIGKSSLAVYLQVNYYIRLFFCEY